MILVTGASGKVGRSVAEQLSDHGEPIRVLSRTATSEKFPDGVQVVQGDLTKPDGIKHAFDNVDRVFLFTPATGPGTVADTAYRCGVRKVVLLSSIVTQKADPKTNVIAARHHAAEQLVIDSGLSWTFLRPDTFAANALEWAQSVRVERVVRQPYGRSQRCPIHERDVAAVAVAALLEPGHESAAYWLTGPETITVIDQVRAISDAIGETITFEEIKRSAALAQMVKSMPESAAERLLDYAAKSIHNPPPVSDTVERIAGRPPLSFAQWARDHVQSFR